MKITKSQNLRLLNVIVIAYPMSCINKNNNKNKNYNIALCCHNSHVGPKPTLIEEKDKKKQQIDGARCGFRYLEYSFQLLGMSWVMPRRVIDLYDCW
jgi:hypothetical protein